MRPGSRLRGARFVAWICAVAMVWTVLSGGVAVAHPLGNFTVNSLARVDVAGDTLWVHYVLDQAEVPTLVDVESAQSDPEGFARRRAAAIADGLRLQVDGVVVPLTVDQTDLSLPDGEAGMVTLRLAVRFAAELPLAPAGTVRDGRLSNDHAVDRIGWREIVVGSRGDGEVVQSDVPADDLADDLRAYPDELLDRPPDVRSASFTFRVGTESLDPLPLAGDDWSESSRGGDRLSRMFTSLIESPWSAMALVIAFGVGALHALGPGHGKTMMAAYLMGTRGRARDALVLAAAVALMHSASVLVLGFLVLNVASLAEPEVVYPWLSLLSGLAVTAVGIHLCRQRFGRASPLVNSGVPGYDHGYGHGHAHGHGHGHGHSHGHGAVTVSPTSVKGILALASAGGLLPSPAALLVLLGAISVGRMGAGLALVAAFTLGLASALAAVGLFLVYGRDIAESLPGGRAIAALPRTGAVALVVLGLAIVIHASTQPIV